MSESVYQSAWTELRKKWTELMGGECQSWMSLVLQWIKQSQSGKLFAGVLSLMILRPMVDRINRYIQQYPPGTIGFIPVLSTIASINPNGSDFFLSQYQKYGPISLHYAGLSPIAVVNSFEAAKLVYTGSVINRDGITNSDDRQRSEKLFSDLVGPSHFGAVNEEFNWSGRRKMFVRAQGALLKSDTLTTMIAQHFEDKVAPQIKDGKVWTDQREVLTRIAFNTMFHFGFGSKIECSEEEMTDFIASVLNAFKVLRFVFFGRAFVIPSLGPILASFLAGDKIEGMLNAKSQTERWFSRFRDSPDRSECQYAEWLLNWVNDGGISFDHANADLGGLFLAGTHTTTTNLEQLLMHCARNPGLTDRMRSDLKKVFNEPSEFSLEGIRVRTPLVYAFVLESLRLSESIWFNLPRVLSEDLRVEEYGYTLPKGTMISLNIYGIHRDTRDFDDYGWGNDALVFNPQRWINQDGMIDKETRNRLMTFGVGPRDCPGAELARKQLILILSHFVWRYKIEPSDDDTLALPKFGDFLGVTSPFPLRYSFCK